MTVRPQFRFQTILAAADFSDASCAAKRYAQAIAKVHGAKLIIAHIIDPVGFAYAGGEPERIRKDKAAHEEVARIENETRSRGIPVHSASESELIRDRILEAVRNNHADLLVLGTKAITEAGHMALGIVARRLLARTPCPMLLVPADSEKHLFTAGSWRKVLIATDFSLASLEALGYAHRVAYEKLLVVHAKSSVEASGNNAELERLRFLAPFNESHTVPVDHVVTNGDAGGVIAEHARKFHADLVVLGSPVDELTEEDSSTSTVLQVVSSVDCPVLCVPSTLDAPVFEAARIKEVAHAC